MKISGIKEFYQNFFEYNRQVNQQLASSFEKDFNQLSPKIIQLACHIINAHSIWNARIIGKTDPCKPWSSFPLIEFAQKDEENFQNTMKILELEAFNRMVNYRNSFGNEYNNQVSTMLTHIVNHSTYHRGQLAMLMRESDLEPISSDYILFKRVME